MFFHNKPVFEYVPSGVGVGVIRGFNVHVPSFIFRNTTSPAGAFFTSHRASWVRWHILHTLSVTTRTPFYISSANNIAAVLTGRLGFFASISYKTALAWLAPRSQHLGVKLFITIRTVLHYHIHKHSTTIKEGLQHGMEIS